MTSPTPSLDEIEAHREISLCLSKRDLKKFPLPWRVEEDWACEITAANGKAVCKIPYPKDLHIAHLIVSLANANHPAAIEQHKRALAVCDAASRIRKAAEHTAYRDAAQLRINTIPAWDDFVAALDAQETSR